MIIGVLQRWVRDRAAVVYLKDGRGYSRLGFFLCFLFAGHIGGRVGAGVCEREEKGRGVNAGQEEMEVGGKEWRCRAGKGWGHV